MEYPLLIKNLLLHPIAYHPDQEIVYADKRRVRYREFRARVKQLANALTQRGIGQGDVVAVVDYDSHRYLECYFAIPMIGAVLHTVNVRLSPEQMLYTINHAEDDLILVHKDFVPLIESIQPHFETVKALVILDDDADACAYEQMLAEASATFDFPDLDENTRATTFYTTGTTGDPKGVWFSHRQLVLHTLTTIATFASSAVQGRFHREDVYMPITPMFHVHAWGFPYVATMLGVKQVYPGPYIPEKLLELIDREHVTLSHCVPTILHMMLTHPQSQQVDLSGWKAIIGGSALPKGLCRAALDRGIDIFAGYGMSETCPILTVTQLDEEMLQLDRDAQVEIRTRTGRPIGLVELEIVDEDMHPQPHDGVHTGEIVVKTPWLTPEYTKNPSATEELYRGGYLHTGDVATIDTQGFVRITDRVKDIIKVSGEWVSSLRLEDILSKHPAVSEVAVIGIPHPRWGEIPLGLVVLKPDISATEKELIGFIKRSIKEGVLAREGMLIRIALVDAIAKTSVGKIDKKRLRQLYAEGKLGAKT